MTSSHTKEKKKDHKSKENPTKDNRELSRKIENILDERLIM